jgi:hypothetical protein
MDDQDVLDQIKQLIEEERALRNGSGLDDVGRERIAELEVRLDQCWDLLRRREARVEYGQNPSAESVRPEAVVERYQQ